MTRTATEPTAAEHIVVSGVVQGVGFRPFVYRLARELGLSGTVGNDSVCVFIDVAGPAPALDSFAARLVTDAPPLARVERVERVTADPSTASTEGFAIVESRVSDRGRTFVPPDTAVCDDCRRELFDPTDRRYRHPFITCTNCGPRFTIITSVPYDRPSTTMAGFAMCPACAAEYADPGDRRYHAQPIGCHDCGPRLSWQRCPTGSCADIAADVDRYTGPGRRSTQRRTRDDATQSIDPISACVAALRAGAIVAIKGIGGYHLACDATNAQAIARLRERKHRADKPFAVMVADLDAAAGLGVIDTAEAELLTSPARPIVLVRAVPGALPAAVAPGNPLVGLMLAYTPVQHLLFAAGLGPLVMTSANFAGEPIAYRTDDAVRLGEFADAVLDHDRPIHVPCDDSVVRVVDGALMPIRRARGYAPIPIAFPAGRRSVLATGGELKNTFCLASPTTGWVSQHLGDMENLATLTAFEASIDQFRSMYDVTPDVVATDLHPGYMTTKWARRQSIAPVVGIQHHHAHVAAIAAEVGFAADQPVIGLAFDGTGYGTDGTIWGGELLAGPITDLTRLTHLAPIPLPGGDGAVRHPYRIALAHLRAAGVEWTNDLPPVREAGPNETLLLDRQLTTGFGCVPTTSMGRLFDAVASLIGLRHQISYEAQAAIELEIAAERSAGPGESDAVDEAQAVNPDVAARRRNGYRFAVADGQFDAAPVISAIAADVRRGVDPGLIALDFHHAVADVIDALVRPLPADRPVLLSGGVFQNALLVGLVARTLRAAGRTVHTHRLVPPNDGGLSLGQAFIAAHLQEVV